MIEHPEESLSTHSSDPRVPSAPQPCPEISSKEAPRLGINPLPPGKSEWNFRYVIFKQILVIDGWGIFCEIVLIWMSLEFTDDQSTLVQVMAWCRQATSHYLSQCGPRSLSPYRITRPQRVNSLASEGCESNFTSVFFKPYEMISCALPVKMVVGEWHKIPLVRIQHWCMQRLGASRHQAITWANVDPDLCWNMAPQGHNELTIQMLNHQWRYINMYFHFL